MQPRVLQRFEQAGGRRIAAGGDLVDRLAGVAERAFGEARQRVFVRPGLRAHRSGKQQADGEYERQRAIAEATHCSQSPARVALGGGERRRLPS